ncbi:MULTISPECIES: DUF167 domain-containing protein [unclassified Acidocella]|uniref:DUF167 domain-containing protein n=2 Tax=Acidocella TaxID=50709 RepID=UPI001F08D109|nr:MULTISPECIES: DUF167 domain-containing protein [unclassified Acidocella]WBO58404.1 DUF167 domain-containing protein [Acidocella sp. MX-AZ03]
MPKDEMRFWDETSRGLSLAVKAQPGARRVAIGPVVPAAAAPGWPQARLKVAVNAPPEDGKANEAIIAALAAWLGVKAGTITLVAGQTSREKRFLITPSVPVPEL